MARDNHPRIRQERELARKKGKRAPFDRVLIVCEGSKTEPNYFNDIRTAFRLPWANVQVQPSEYGTSPMQVAQYARDLFLKGDPHRRISAKAFDQVFVVFDRDDHLQYHDALALVNSCDKKHRNDTKTATPFRAIASVPCFELWLLLHYEDVHASLHRDEVLRRLNAHLPSYAKGVAGVFMLTRSHLEEALQRAERLALSHTAHENDGPFTAVHELVAMLVGFNREGGR